MRFVNLDTVDSTSAEIRRRVEQGERGPLWLSATTQTQGRGRRGRAWESPKGNLYCTGLYPRRGGLQDTALLSFVAALAISDMLEAYIPKDLITLKWPNDVLVDGAKISGILLEAGQDWVSIGIGINLVAHPDDTLYPTTHMLEHIPQFQMAGPEPIMTGPDAVLAILVSRFDHWRAILGAQGVEAILSAWTEKSRLIGHAVTVNLATESFTGTALGLGANGELQVKLNDGTIRDIHAGDVFFGNRETP